jgi:hypothetical protein
LLRSWSEILSEKYDFKKTIYALLPQMMSQNGWNTFGMSSTGAQVTRKEKQVEDLKWFSTCIR